MEKLKAIDSAESKSRQPAHHEYHEAYDLDHQGCIISDARLAQRLIDTFNNPWGQAAEENIILAGNDLYRFSANAQLWDKVSPHQLTRRLIRWDGAKTDRGFLKIDAKTIGGIRNMIYKYELIENQSNFFEDAPEGIALADGRFVKIDLEGKGVSLEALDRRHKARFAIDAPLFELKQIEDIGPYGRKGTLLHRYLTSTFKPLERSIERPIDDQWPSEKTMVDALDKARALGEMCFVALARGARLYKRAGILYGPPGTGKSQAIEMIMAMIPEDGICSISPQEINDPAGRHVGQLQGKMLNAVTELSSKISAGNVFKGVISCERVRANPKNQQPFDLEPRCQHIYAGNVLPRFKRDQGALLERMLPIKFEVKFRGSSIEIKNIGKTIAKEEPHELIAWALSMGIQWLERGQFTMPSSAQKVFEEWKMNSDHVAVWLAEMAREPGIKRAATRWLTTTEVYEPYTQWVEKSGHKPTSRREFISRLRDAGVEVTDRPKGGYRRVNLELISEEDRANGDISPF